MWQRECLPPKTLIPPRRLHRIRGRYAALSTLVRRAYIQRRTGTGQLLFPFSKYAPVTTRFPVWMTAIFKPTRRPIAGPERPAGESGVCGLSCCRPICASARASPPSLILAWTTGWPTNKFAECDLVHLPRRTNRLTGSCSPRPEAEF